MTTTKWKTLLATGAAAGALAFTAVTPMAQADDTQYADYTGTLESPHFTVTVHDVERTGAQGQFMDADITVCARNVPDGKRTRVSTDPWTVVHLDGSEHPAGEVESARTSYPTGRHNPDGPTIQEKYLADGECASGVITFVAPEEYPKAIVYENSYGETLVWRYDS